MRYTHNRSKQGDWIAHRLDCQSFQCKNITFESKGAERFEQAFKGLPKDNMYRMWVDRDKQAQGGLVFDVKEPGYAKGMQKCFELVRNTISQPNTLDSIIELHDACIDGVVDSNGKPFRKGIEGVWAYGLQMKSNPVSESARQEWIRDKLIWFFPDQLKYVTQQNAVLKGGDVAQTDAARKEQNRVQAFEALETGNYLSYIRIPQDPRVHSRFDPANTKANETWARAQVSKRWNRYYEVVNRDPRAGDDSILNAISDIVRALEIFHIFPDGNQRTLVFALLTKLLIENGFCPTILANPNVFDGYHSLDELVVDIKEGIMTFRRYLTE